MATSVIDYLILCAQFQIPTEVVGFEVGSPLSYLKTAGDGWTTAYVHSTQPAVNVYASFDDPTKVCGFGLTSALGSGGHDENGFTYGFICVGTSVQLKQGSTTLISVFNSPTDILGLEKLGDTVNYTQNGTTIYSVSGVPSNNLYVDFDAYNSGSLYTNVSFA